MDFFRKHKKKQAEDVKQQNTGTNDRKEESKLGDNVFNTAQQQLGDRKELEKKPEQPAPVLVVPPSLVYIEQDAYIPTGGMMPGSGFAPAAPPPVVMYVKPAYVLDLQPAGSLACLNAW
ncbi:unnamed protein product [Sphagnum troendelagicum]|uniref:Uncharacterized protein n=1 Tax=Sphagnum troendelagicum TaxID=128251 RepID=A0ABP0TLV5_9BRYO